MSLYNSVSQQLISKGLIATVTGGVGAGVSGMVGGALSGITSGLGGGLAGKAGGMLANAVTNRVTSAATQAAHGLINKHIPSNLMGAIGTGSGILGSLMQGDLSGAAIKGMDAVLSGGLIDKALSGKLGRLMGGRGSSLVPSPLFGGISAIEAKQIVMESLNTQYCKKNLFMVEVSSPHGDFSQQFNLFCTGLDYAPSTITAEKRKIGAATVNTVQSSEPIELRMTTLDDQNGTLKRWFATHAALAAHPDGTVGVPAEYAVKIKVVHGFITDGSNRGGYFDIGQFMSANIDISLSRREDNLEEITMTFAQLDTFMTVV